MAGCFALALHMAAAWALMNMMPARIVMPEQVVMASILPKTRLPPPPVVPRLDPIAPPSITMVVPLIPQIRIEQAAPSAIQERSGPPTQAPTLAPDQPRPMPSGTYLAKLMAHLAAFKRYPYDSGTHAGGTVKVRFTADRGGHVLSCAVVSSSGTAALDQAACDLFKRADPLPAVPGDYPGDMLDLVLPVSYSYLVR
jgi:protein TonB